MDLRAKLQQMKVSIRLSVLSIVLILLIGTSFIIIGINYFTFNTILVASAKNSLLLSGDRVAEQIRNYLKPLNTHTTIAQKMFFKKIIQPQEITRLLYSLIFDNENLVAAYWGDINGNLYWLNRENQGYVEKIILHDACGFKTKKRNLDAYASPLITKDSTFTAIDARLRPWYRDAEQKKDLTWVVYRFIETGNQESQLGVTSAFPVYDSKGELLGVLGIDMLLGAISEYVENIKLTENSFIFVVDATGNLISAYTKQSELSEIDTFKISQSFKLYRQKLESPFIYSHEGNDYIVAYDKILDVKSKEPWFVGIVTPINDIVAPLRKNIWISLIFLGITLFIGIFMAGVFSSSLSRPIRKLADDSNLICQLKLENIKHYFSRIKEIANMADSFMRMKNALHSFQRYMPVALIKKLIISNKVATLGGEIKELTLFFTDIQDFTKLSEGFEPEELMQYLSEYFQIITKVIIEMHGTVDKYVGDGIMAFWGAPIDDESHVLHACQAALQVQKILGQLNLKWQGENKPQLVTRFGISSGRVVVGNVGSDDRLSYTALGDSVNLASRLEGLNKVYGSTIMVSEFTYEKVKDKFQFRLLDRVAVKGKTKGVYVYELLGDLIAEPDLKLEEYKRDFYQAFLTYESGDWQAALPLFKNLEQKYPDDRIVKIFITRITSFIVNPPIAWKGVWVVEEK